MCLIQSIHQINDNNDICMPENIVNHHVTVAAENENHVSEK